MNETRQSEPTRQKPVVLIMDPNEFARRTYAQMRSTFTLSIAVNAEVGRTYFAHHHAEVAAVIVGADATKPPESALAFIAHLRERGFKRLIVGASDDSLCRRRFRDEADCAPVVTLEEVFGILRGYLLSGAEHAPLPPRRTDQRPRAFFSSPPA